MRKAFYFDKEKDALTLVTLKELVLLRGGETNPKKLSNLGLYCPDCGERVHVYDVAGAYGFKLAGQEVSNRHARAQPGFHHLDERAGEDCPSSYAKDLRFAGLARPKYDFRVRERNEKILRTPDVRLLNANVLRRLWTELAGRDLENDDRNRLHTLAKTKKLYHMEALGEHPWLLPYYIMGMEKHHEREYLRKKGHYLLGYIGSGKQILPYCDFEGNLREAEVPEHIAVHFINKTKRGRLVVGNMKRGATIFKLSEDSAYSVAGICKPERKEIKLGAKMYQTSLFPTPPDHLRGPI